MTFAFASNWAIQLAVATVRKQTPLAAINHSHKEAFRRRLPAIGLPICRRKAGWRLAKIVR